MGNPFPSIRSVRMWIIVYGQNPAIIDRTVARLSDNGVKVRAAYDIKNLRKLLLEHVNDYVEVQLMPSGDKDRQVEIRLSYSPGSVQGDIGANGE